MASTRNLLVMVGDSSVRHLKSDNTTSITENNTSLYTLTWSRYATGVFPFHGAFFLGKWMMRWNERACHESVLPATMKHSQSVKLRGLSALWPCFVKGLCLSKRRRRTKSVFFRFAFWPTMPFWLMFNCCCVNHKFSSACVYLIKCLVLSQPHFTA